MAHALLSASSAHRWLHCTPAPRLEAMEADTGSVYAREGTLAHEIGERILKGEDYTDLTTDELFYPGMVAEVEEYTTYCLERFAEAKLRDPTGATLLVEERLDFSDYVPDGFGTGDCVILGGDQLEVVDLKFGKGVEVDVVDNPQLKLYAWGAFRDLGAFYDIRHVTMTVAQVRLGSIKSYTIPIEDLATWMIQEVAPVAIVAYRGDGEPVAGDWCTFCKVRAKCRARAEYMTEIYTKHKGKLTLSLEEVAKVVLMKKDMEGWLADVSDRALEEALQGVQFPGLKLVEGRSNRKIEDPDMLADRLRAKGFEDEAIYKPKQLETLTKLESLVGKAVFAELGEGCVIKPPGKPTLVSKSDKRPEYMPVMDEFSFEQM